MHKSESFWKYEHFFFFTDVTILGLSIIVMKNVLFESLFFWLGINQKIVTEYLKW
jgi:hypothetical protein